MPTFDVEKALAQLDGDEETLAALIATSKRTSPQYIADIQSAIDAADSEKLASVAHCFKGSLGVFAAEAAAELARQIEQHARAADFAGAAKVLAELEAEYARLHAALSSFVDSAQ